MTPDRWREVRTALDRVIDLDPGGRALALADTDAGVREEVESLLAYEGEALLETHSLESAIGDFTGSHPGRVGSYRLIREVGRGGMGVVYLAERDDGQFEKRVAVKLLPAMFRGADMERWFERERAILARLDHPGIARLLDGGVAADGRPFLIMEYVEGVPLTAAAREMKVRERLALFVTACEAVSYAHGKLVVHGDLKPSNVLVDVEGHPKLLDFGLARVLRPGETDSERTGSQRLLMTPAYASPEQIRGEALGVTTDVFSLGVMLYELVSGQRPFENAGLSTPQVLVAVCEQNAVAPSRAGSVEGREMDSIVQKALSKEPARRYASVEALSRDVLAYLEHRPVAARPAGTLYRLGKFVRRNRWSAALGAAALLAISVTSGLAFREAARARRHFDQTRKLATSVLFELHDAIRPLPGSTKARELIVRRGTEYLEALSREPGEDAGLRRELAKGYLHLGDITGNSTEANLGDTRRSLESYRKGVALLEGVAKEFPADAEIAKDLGSAYRLLGYSLLGNERAAEGRAAFEKALRLSGGRGGRVQALNHFALGIALVREGNYLKAADEYRAALGLFESVARGGGRPDGGRDVALCHKRLGAIYGKLGNHDKAVASFLLARDIEEKIVQANPGDSGAALDLSFSYSDLSIQLKALGRLDEALAAIGKALAIRVKQADADPGDSRAGKAAAHSLAVRAGIVEAQGHLLESLGDTVEAARRLEVLARRPGARSAEQDEGRAFAEYELARTLAGLGRNVEARPHWKTAYHLWVPLHARGVLSAEYLQPFERVRKLFL